MKNLLNNPLSPQYIKKIFCYILTSYLFYKNSKIFGGFFHFSIEKIQESIMESDEIYKPSIRRVKKFSKYRHCYCIDLGKKNFPVRNRKNKSFGLTFSSSHQMISAEKKFVNCIIPDWCFFTRNPILFKKIPEPKYEISRRISMRNEEIH